MSIKPTSSRGFRHVGACLIVAMSALVCVARDVFAGERASGRDIAATCASCHVAEGRGGGGIPSLAGRDAQEIVRLVKEFRDGRRPSTLMQQLARGYDDAQIEAAAVYLAAQKQQP